MALTFLLGGRSAIGQDALGGLGDYQEDAPWVSRIVRDRGSIDVEPGRLRGAGPFKNESLVTVGQRAASQPHPHEVVDKIGDLRPALAAFRAEQARMAPPCDRHIGVVVDRDPVLSPIDDHRNRAGADEADGVAEAAGPAFQRAEAGL